MPLKDAPKIVPEDYETYTREELLAEMQNLMDTAYHNRQLIEFACKDHCQDFREVEIELDRAGIPEDDGYSCYTPGGRVALLAKKVHDERCQKAEHEKTSVRCDNQGL